MIGELLAGVILGTTGLQIIDPSKSDLSLLYDIGFATLMFTVGMNVPLRDRRIRGAAREGNDRGCRGGPAGLAQRLLGPASPAAVPGSCTPS